MSYHFCPECGAECVQCEAIFNGLNWFDQDKPTPSEARDGNIRDNDDDAVSCEETGK